MHPVRQSTEYSVLLLQQESKCMVQTRGKCPIPAVHYLKPLPLV